MTLTIKYLAGLSAAALLSASVAVLPATAEKRHHPISSTKVNTSYKYNTQNRVNNVTRYRDINRTNHVTHTKRIVNVTRVQPINRVNMVTRVHNRTAVLRENQNVAQTRMLPGRTITTGQTRRIVHNTARPSTSTVYRYHTVNKVNNITRYKDVNRTRYMKLINRNVNVTRIQPITRVNVVTRIHDRTAVRNRVVNVAQTRVLPAKTITTSKVIQMGSSSTPKAWRSGKMDRMSSL
ncbi:hypothetical protein [Bradyrhizobium sp. LHD-71]|uniref:hypothetical protein n=1 Tax=Bradyrhizobium sp. LHD-71 TaxID=3072141 RepID=UPI00280E1E7A|nr:hypothetical protein [Bradyrhizobium sp. LHD-71]MDQ8727991.1 hypothetical protein [Bradyrhizobium sp. LHD-71]